MIVIEGEDAPVLRVDGAADPRIAGTQITVGDVRWPRRVFELDRVAAPGPVLAMSSNDDPLFAQRVPAFFPGHDNIIWRGPIRASRRSAGAFAARKEFDRP